MSDNFISEILQIWTDIKYEASIHFIEQLKAQNLSMATLSYTSWKHTYTPYIMVFNRKRRSSDERYDELSIFLGLYQNKLSYFSRVYQRLKPYGKAPKKTYIMLLPTMKLSLILFRDKTTKQTSI